MESLFFQITILLVFTIGLAVVIRLLRQPLMIAYIVAGIAAGPFLFDIVSHADRAFPTLAQFGVVLLLFIIGMSLNIREIRFVGRPAIIAGVGQVIITAFFGYLLLRFLQFTPFSALALSIAITFSSTIVIMTLLSEKRALSTVYGRYTIGLMIVQDIIAVLLLAVFSVKGAGGSALSTLFFLTLKGIGLLGLLYLFARFLLPVILDRIAESTEFLFVFALTWCFGIASIAQIAGFSFEIGAVAAGIALGSSPYQFEIASRIKPLRDFFVMLFFVILGSELSIGNTRAVLLPAIVLSLFIIIGNPIILYLLFRAQKFTRRNSFLASVTAAQVSEFGFILLFAGQGLGLVGERELGLFTIVALITIFVSSYVIKYNEELYRLFTPLFALCGRDRAQQHEDVIEPFSVWIFGYHRAGWKIGEMLKHKGLSFAVADHNPKVIQRARARGIPAYYGDVGDSVFLEHLGLEKATLIISTVPDHIIQQTIIAFVRARSKDAFIVATLFHRTHLAELYEAGANYIMMPHLLGGNWMANILQERPWTKSMFNKLKQEQAKEFKQQFSRE